MIFRIRHKPTGRYLKCYGGAMWWTLLEIHRGEIKECTTDKVGKIYTTRRGAEGMLKDLQEDVVFCKETFKGSNDWEIEPVILTTSIEE